MPQRFMNPSPLNGYVEKLYARKAAIMKDRECHRIRVIRSLVKTSLQFQIFNRFRLLRLCSCPGLAESNIYFDAF